MIDPVISWTFSLLLAALWTAAATSKLRDFNEFERALAAYRLLPLTTNRPVAGLLVSLEASIALGLLLPPLSDSAAVAGACLLLAYSGAMSINLFRGRDKLDCGCHFGSARTIHWQLVGRNIALAGFSLLLLLPVSQRPLPVADWLFIGLFTAFGMITLMLYQSIAHNERIFEEGFHP